MALSFVMIPLYILIAAMKKTFFLIRHGQKVLKVKNPPLSDLGQKQAVAVACFLTSFQIEQLYSSPLIRTMQTAKQISERLGLPIKKEELLKERVSWGDNPDQSNEDFIKMWRHAYVDRHYCPKVGDSSFNAGERLRTALVKNGEGKFERIAFVTHAGIMTDFLLNTFSETCLKEIANDFYQKYDKSIHEASVTTLEYDTDSNTFELKKLSDVSFFTPELIIKKHSILP